MMQEETRQYKQPKGKVALRKYRWLVTTFAAASLVMREVSESRLSVRPSDSAEVGMPGPRRPVLAEASPSVRRSPSRRGSRVKVTASAPCSPGRLLQTQWYCWAETSCLGTVNVAGRHWGRGLSHV